MGSTRILLADDNPELRERVAQLLRYHFNIVGSVGDGQQALESALTLNPDILLLDISMPILDGIEVASRLRDSGCEAKVIFLTVHRGSEWVEAGFSVGAFGYVLKGRIRSDLIPAIEAALQGRRFASPGARQI